MAGEAPNLQSHATALWFLVALTVFGALDYMLNTGMVALAVSLERRLPVIATWREHFSGLWLSYFGGAFGGAADAAGGRTHGMHHCSSRCRSSVPVPHAVGRTEDHISPAGQPVYRRDRALAQAVDAKAGDARTCGASSTGLSSSRARSEWTAS